MKKNGATKILQNLRPIDKSDFSQFYAHNPRLERTQKSQTEDLKNFLNMECEKHLGTKIDFLLVQSSRLLQATQIQIWQCQCEQKRTQVDTNLILALVNPSISGYMPSGKQSIFWKRMLAYLGYTIAQGFISQHHAMNHCYNRIPTLPEQNSNSIC